MSFNFNDNKFPEDFKSAVAEAESYLDADFDENGWSFIADSADGYVKHSAQKQGMPVGWFIEESVGGGILFGFSTYAEADEAATSCSLKDQMNGYDEHCFMVEGFVSSTGEVFQLM